MSTPTDMIARATALIPDLRARAAEAEANRVLQDETIHDLVESELMKMMVPKRFGGLELDWSVGSRILDLVAQGDGSVAWVLNAYICMTWVVATFPEEVQEEVFGGRGYVIGPCPMNPNTGTAKKVEGGYRVTLNAPFASGVHHSQWAVCCAMEEADAGASGPPRALAVVIPRSDYSYDLSTWATLGMRGTGSPVLVAKDIFVPDRRAMDMTLLVEGTTQGSLSNPAPMYRVPFIVGFALMSAGMLIGMARHMSDAFLNHVKTRVFALTGQAQAGMTAAAALNAADLDCLMANVADGSLSIEDRARFRLNTAYVALLCRQAVDVAKAGSGSNAMRDGNPIQQVYRDFQMVGGSQAYQLDFTEELYGRLRLDLPIEPGNV